MIKDFSSSSSSSNNNNNNNNNNNKRYNNYNNKYLNNNDIIMLWTLDSGGIFHVMDILNNFPNFATRSIKNNYKISIYYKFEILPIRYQIAYLNAI
ncbi:hypothetical protein BCR32DRAFT_285095 [Anaeromyces robustus]|uniref:Uncharacterized protein n=1 Tax=Anaeromyces robustus TaxID=1754192 RepID=A0A1Y1WQI4_9FUNG|nr:hypothetical protein BCR32DRAFT_285095 [Anaeromyces robustus]|eukprot:ORX75536.1 hypothetical protein BCR32DRAFT_285095 [Anaeromyces robustus]